MRTTRLGITLAALSVSFPPPIPEYEYTGSTKHPDLRVPVSTEPNPVVVTEYDLTAMQKAEEKRRRKLSKKGGSK